MAARFSQHGQVARPASAGGLSDAVPWCLDAGAAGAEASLSSAGFRWGQRISALDVGRSGPLRTVGQQGRRELAAGTEGAVPGIPDKRPLGTSPEWVLLGCVSLRAGSPWPWGPCAWEAVPARLCPQRNRFVVSAPGPGPEEQGCRWPWAGLPSRAKPAGPRECPSRGTGGGHVRGQPHTGCGGSQRVPGALFWSLSSRTGPQRMALSRKRTPALFSMAIQVPVKRQSVHEVGFGREIHVPSRAALLKTVGEAAGSDFNPGTHFQSHLLMRPR